MAAVTLVLIQIQIVKAKRPRKHLVKVCHADCLVRLLDIFSLPDEKKKKKKKEKDKKKKKDKKKDKKKKVSCVSSRLNGSVIMANDVSVLLQTC